MFTRRARLLWLLLVLSELLLVAFSFEVAYLLRAITPVTRQFYLRPGVTAGLLAAACALWVTSGFALGVYRSSESFDARRVLRRTISQSFWFGLLVATAIYLLKLGEVSRLFLALFVGLNFAVQMSYRVVAHRMRAVLQQGLSGRRNYLIVGTGPKALELARLIEKNQEHGDRVIALIREPAGQPDRSLATGTPQHGYPVHEMAELPRMLHEHVVDEVIFAVSKTQLEAMEEIFLDCEEQGVKTRVLVDFFPHLRSEITLDLLERHPLLTFSNAPENEYLLFLKRAVDLVLAVILLILTAPLFLIIAILVKLSSPGPVIYSQIRCGLNGRKFRFYKFRSMYPGAEQDQSLLAYLNEKDGPVFKISRDPRVTPIGSFLRKTSLDELPQLFNILKGDMSFVGPRPPLPQEVEQYEKWHRRRLRMKPGLTCLWALEGRSELTFARWMKLDMEYIDHWSLGLDFKIMLRTIPRVLTGRGAS